MSVDRRVDIVVDHVLVVGVQGGSVKITLQKWTKMT